MPVKIFAAAVAVVLMIAYLVPVVVKLQEVALGIVIMIGLVLMFIDLWQSFSEKDI
ncbi:MAG TPA: hypothetical protein VK996_14010 [Ramlibacter sp.]|nr:hypothetical protein [Ramlibacter sp.]